jgi:hypothetical protein
VDSCYFHCSGGPLPDLVDRAGKAPAHETRPCGGPETTGRELGEDVVCEVAAIGWSHNGVAIREPVPGLMAHAGTIATNGSRGVIDITFIADVSRKMRS